MSPNEAVIALATHHLSHEELLYLAAIVWLREGVTGPPANLAVRFLHDAEEAFSAAHAALSL